MNSQNSISQKSLSQLNITHDSDDEDIQQLPPETELWEPPFERWIRMADDLLRDWPGTNAA